MKKVLIKNGTIVTATDEFKGDLLLADGKIAAIGGAIDASSADEEIGRASCRERV